MKNLKNITILLLSTLLCSIFSFAKPKIGITLLPIYSYVSNIVKDKMEVVPVLPENVDVHTYKPVAKDIKKLTDLDYIVVNGIGHDEFVKPMIRTALKNNKKLKIINANTESSIMNTAGQKRGTVRNPHTFISITQSIQQVRYITKMLSQYDAKNKDFYNKNAQTYINTLRRIKQEEVKKIRGLNVSNIKVATTHAGYDYLLNEFGLTVSLVIEPAHGQAANANDLKFAINQINSKHISILFDEEGGNHKNAQTLHNATGITIAQLSHLTKGKYTPKAFENFIKYDLQSVSNALINASKGKK